MSTDADAPATGLDAPEAEGSRMPRRPARMPRTGPQAEGVQERGRRGVATIKRWLEASTFFELQWNPYEHEMFCLLEHCGGSKRFDLVGTHLGDGERPVMVEAKLYSSDSGQYQYMKEFLAIAYSSAHREVKEHGRHFTRHFLWVTSHPFILSRWKELESPELMREAIADNPDIFPGNLTEYREIEEDLLREVASRTTVLLFNPKQESLSLTRHELETIRPHLKRKKVTSYDL